MTESREHEDPIEKRRLEATAVVASKVSQQTAVGVVKRARLWSFFRETLIVILVIVVALLTYRTATEGQRTSSAILHNRQRDCASKHKESLITPSQTTTDVGLQLLASARNDFYLDDCDKIYGRLPTPNLRLLPYLIPQAKH